jgi:hypothetical protein
MTVIDFATEKERRRENARRKTEKEANVLQAGAVFVKAFEELNGGKSFSDFTWIRLGNLYAVASICYYKLDFSPIGDTQFDSLCLYLLANLEEALASRAGGLGEKKFLKAELLEAGTGFILSNFDHYLHDVAWAVEAIMARQRRDLLA